MYWVNLANFNLFNFSSLQFFFSFLDTSELFPPMRITHLLRNLMNLTASQMFVSLVTVAARNKRRRTRRQDLFIPCMLMISADTYLNIILNMNQTHVLFTCISAGKTSPAVWCIYTSNISLASPSLLPFFFVF